MVWRENRAIGHVAVACGTACPGCCHLLPELQMMGFVCTEVSVVILGKPCLFHMV